MFSLPSNPIPVKLPYCQVESPSSARTIITAGVKGPALLPPNKRYQPHPPHQSPSLTSGLYKTVLVTTATTVLIHSPVASMISYWKWK